MKKRKFCKKTIAISTVFLITVLIFAQAVFASVTMTGKIKQLSGRDPNHGGTVSVELDLGGGVVETITFVDVSPTEYAALQLAKSKGWPVKLTFHEGGSPPKYYLDNVEIISPMSSISYLIQNHDDTLLVLSQSPGVTITYLDVV